MKTNFALCLCLAAVLCAPRAFCADNLKMQGAMRYEICMGTAAVIAAPEGTALSAQSSGTARTDTVFFEKEKRKWLRAKARHEKYLDVIPLKDNWNLCLIPIGIGSVWVIAGDILNNTPVEQYGRFNILYGLVCVAALPFMPTEKEYEERTTELNNIGVQNGFIK